MRKYRFKLTGTAKVEAVVEVEAGDEVEADDMIDDMINNGSVCFEVSDEDWPSIKDTILLGSDPVIFVDKNQKSLPL